MIGSGYYSNYKKPVRKIVPFLDDELWLTCKSISAKDKSYEEICSSVAECDELYHYTNKDEAATKIGGLPITPVKGYSPCADRHISLPNNLPDRIDAEIVREIMPIY